MTFTEQDFAAPQQFTESDFADAGPFTERDFEEAPAQQDFWQNSDVLQRWKSEEQQRQALSGFYDPGTEFTSAIANDPVGFAMSPLTIAGDVLNAAASDVGATVGTFAAGEPGQAGVQGGNLYEYFNKDREGPLPQERVLADVAQDNPALATTGKIAAGLVKSAPMLALMPQGALGKLVAAGFTADMISHAGDAATRLGTEMGKPENERDADALTTALSDIIQSAAFAPLTGAHAAGRVIGERVAPRREAIRELANALKAEPRVPIAELPTREPTTPTDAEFIAGDRPQPVTTELPVNAPKDVVAEPIKETAPLPPEVVADSDLRVSVQSPAKMGEKEVPGYVQVDSMVGGKNQWSSNPTALKKQGYEIPTEAELQKLPQGQYTLAEAKAKLAEMNAPVPIEVDAINRLQPAVLIDGKPALGKSHIEAALEVGTPEAIEAASKPENQGFVFDGKFISREQAAQMVGVKGKLTSERLTELRENLKKPPVKAQPVETVKAEVEPTPPAAAKEPWEMTRKAWDKYLFDTEGGFQTSPRDIQAVEVRNQAHRQYVEQALREGKPVPESVRAEYPDLAPKPAPAAAKAKELMTPEELGLSDSNFDFALAQNIVSEAHKLKKQINAQLAKFGGYIEPSGKPRYRLSDYVRDGDIVRHPSTKAAPGAAKAKIQRLQSVSVGEIRDEFRSQKRSEIENADTPEKKAALESEFSAFLKRKNLENEASRANTKAQNTKAFLENPEAVLNELQETGGMTFGVGEMLIANGIAKVTKKRVGKGTFVGKGTLAEGTVSNFEWTVDIGGRKQVIESGSRNDRRSLQDTEGFVAAEAAKAIAAESKPTPAAPGAEAKPPTQTAGERKASIRAKLNRKGEAGFVNAEILGELIGYGKQVYEKGMTAGKWVAHAVAEFGERVRQLAIQAWETIKAAYESSGLSDETGAISTGGGGARRKGKKPTLSQPGTALTDKVEMRTLSERATTSEKIPEPVQEKIESAPESYYQVQSLKGVEQASKAKSDAELGATSKDSDAYTSDKLELSTRLLNAGKHEEGYRVFQDLSADLTRMGQVINQAKLFQALRPEHVVTVVNKELVKGGRDPLTVEQSARVEAAAQGRITKQAELERATDEWVKNPTDSNAATAETALSDANKAAVNEQSLVNQFKPRTTSSVLKSVLQGNLLTPISQVANLVGNVSFIPFRAGTRATATAIDMLDAAIRNRPRQVSAAPIGGTKAAVAGLIQGAKQIPSILVRGTGETIKGEPRAGLHPMRAWVKQFAKNPDVPTVGGKIPFSERINLAIEGTFGVPAEIMLRGLGSGDAPFRGAARGRLISEASRLQKLKPSDQRMAQRFPELFFDKATLERIDSEGRAAIFQRHSSTIDRIMELARSRGDLMDFAIATVAPYKLTPWNIVGEILSYNPLIATARSGIEARRGNVRGAEMNAGKALVGGMTIYAGYWLYENGLLSPSLDSRDEQQKARMLAGEVMPPNHINVSGLKRKLAGGDPAFKSGDETVDIFRGGGLAGSLFYMVANIGRDAETSPPGDEMLLSVLKNSTLEQARFGVNQSFLKGVTGLLDAVRYGETDNYIQSYAGTILSIPLPNTLSALSRAQRPYKVDASDPKFTKQLENIVRTRLGFAGLDDYLPLKRGLWGEPLPETPTNANALVYHFFDISKNKQVTSDPVPLELYRLWRKTASSSVIPTPPEKSITADRETRVLTPAQHSRYAELVGSARRDIIGRIVANPEWHQIPDEGKMNILEKVYRSGLERGKEEFMIEAWDKLEAKPAKAGFK